MPARSAKLALVCALVGRIFAEPPEFVFRAIQKDDPTTLRRLLNRGMRANIRDAEGTPALMAAVLYAGADSVNDDRLARLNHVARLVQGGRASVDHIESID